MHSPSLSSFSSQETINLGAWECSKEVGTTSVTVWHGDIVATWRHMGYKSHGPGLSYIGVPPGPSFRVRVCYRHGFNHGTGVAHRTEHLAFFDVKHAQIMPNHPFTHISLQFNLRSNSEPESEAIEIFWGRIRKNLEMLAPPIGINWSSGSSSSSKQQPQVPRPPTAFSWAIRPDRTWPMESPDGHR